MSSEYKSQVSLVEMYSIGSLWQLVQTPRLPEVVEINPSCVLKKPLQGSFNNT